MREERRYSSLMPNITLSLEEPLISKAKTVAKKRGKSVSQLVSEYFTALESDEHKETELAPLTASMVGIMSGEGDDKEEYVEYLERKHS